MQSRELISAGRMSFITRKNISIFRGLPVNQVLEAGRREEDAALLSLPRSVSEDPWQSTTGEEEVTLRSRSSWVLASLVLSRN